MTRCRTAAPALALLAVLPIAAADEPAGTRTVKLDWATVTVPRQAAANTRIAVTVGVEDAKAGMKLGADLHWHRGDGSYAGFLSWGGEAKPVEPGKDVTFHLKVKPKKGLGAVSVLLHLSPTGKFDDRVKEAGIQVPVDPGTVRVLTRKKSWIWIDPEAIGEVPVEGERWSVPVEYYLDPCEDDGATQLTVWAAGPWIDCPDGTYTEKRQHVGYPGMWKRVDCKPGRHREVLNYKAPPAKPRNELQLIAWFQGAGGKKWPWQVRGGTVWLQRKGGRFDLVTDRPGNLFTYDEPVRVAARLGDVPAGEKKTLTYRVTDTRGEVVARGEKAFTTRAGAEVKLELEIARRGTLLIEAEVPGWEKRHTTFCRIPDVRKITGDQPTRFGCTNVVVPRPPERTEALCIIARRLGLTTCRSFFPWNRVQPGRDVTRLEAWDEAIDIANRHGVRPWLCIVGPPAWVQTGDPKSTSFRAFACDWDAWRQFVTAATKRYKGRILGWEWLNEIVPGGSEDPVGDYLRFVRIGTAAVREHAPEMKTLLAGGLWPRSFRMAILKAGAGEHVDVLPVHYSNGPSVREAAEDLRTVGCGDVAVWDDESARGISTWNAPPAFDLTHTLQPRWVLTQWPSELTAGCEKIIYFGGTPSAAGNWSYLYDDLSPRPVAATLAVLAARLHGARPLGTFSLGRGGLFHLFDRDGKAVLIASSYAEDERIALPVGRDEVTVVDYQGNATPLAAPRGEAPLTLGAMPCFVEGADLDVLKTHLVGEILTREAAPQHRGGFKDKVVLGGAPRLTLLRGRTERMNVRVRNLYDRRLAGTVSLAVPDGWSAPADRAFAVPVGKDALLPVALTVPDDAEGSLPVKVTFRFDDEKLPVAVKPVVMAVLDPESLGNLMPNGGFESPAEGPAAEGWGGSDVTARIPAEGLGDGLGRYVMKFGDTKGNWAHLGRTLKLPGGRTYLYSAWIWNENMHAGSNHTQVLADGSVRRMYDVHVFTAGDDNGGWQLYTAHLQAPEGMTEASFTPVCKGSGRALFDNLRVTVFEGTDYAAEARRADKAPVIDGKLGDWPAALTACPLPLIGRNQLSTLGEDEAWSRDDLSGVAWLAWDARNLYLAARVRDDVHRALGGEKAPDGDALVLGLDPTNRGPASTARATCTYVSAASPGGGSGRFTLYRPEGRAAGGRAGPLAKDSSVYDLAIDRSEAGVCVYELRIPLAEIGGLAGDVGTKLGLSLMLTDNDGAGPAAAMAWGDGLHPAWAPQRFGVLTLVD